MKLHNLPAKFLLTSPLTQVDDTVKAIARQVNNSPVKSSELQKGQAWKSNTYRIIENINHYLNELQYLNLEQTNQVKWQQAFCQRSTSEIISSQTCYGCDDYATVFLTLCRQNQIPSRLVVGKRLHKSGAHTWCQVWLPNEDTQCTHRGIKAANIWTHIEPRNNKIPFDYKTASHGPYQILSVSRDHTDSAISCYKDWLDIEKTFDGEGYIRQPTIHNRKDIMTLHKNLMDYYNNPITNATTEITEIIKQKRALIYQIKQGTQGYITNQLTTKDHHIFPNVIFIRDLFVTERFRRRNIGSRLLSHLLQQQFPGRYKAFVVTHHPKAKHLTAMYRRFGFRVTGKTDVGNVILQKDIYV